MTGAILALAGAVGAGFALTQVRQLTRSETAESIVFYFSIVSSCVGLATLPLGWVMPDARTFAILIGLGVSGGVAQICMTLATRYAPASIVAPLNYATLLWASIFGVVLLGERPDRLVLLGAAVVVGAGLALVWRERRRSSGV